MKFLKSFGLGLVTIILLPFFLLLLIVAAVYLAFVYIIETAINIVRFFKGEKGLKKLPEDIKVEAIKAESLRRSMGSESPKKEEVPPPQPTHVYIQQNYYQKDPNQSMDDFARQIANNQQNPYINQASQYQNNPAIPQYIDQSAPINQAQQIPLNENNSVPFDERIDQSENESNAYDENSNGGEEL